MLDQTQLDHSLRGMMPIRRSRDATRLSPINEEKIWARSLQQAKARMGKSETPAPTRQVRAVRAEPRVRVVPPARVTPPPARVTPPPEGRFREMPPPIPGDVWPTTRVPAPLPELHPPAQVIDLAAARAERAASVNGGLPLKAPPLPPTPSMPPPMPPPLRQSMPVMPPPMPSRGSVGATGAATAMAAAPSMAPAVADPQPYWSPAPPVPVQQPPQSNPYAVYEQLGLGAPAAVPARQKATKAVVSAYRGLGFVILTIIVVVLVGYIATSIFYTVSDSWIEPMVVSPTDERVLSLKSELAEKTNLRDKVALELQHTERFISSQQEFQAEFIKAVKADLAERKTTLRRLRALASGYAGERSRIRKTNREFARQSKVQMNREYAARLIDRSEFLQGSYQLGQIANSNLSLAERQAEFETRAASLDGEARALEAILSERTASGDAGLSYEVLKVKQEYDSSRLETLKAIEARASLKESLTRYDAILESIKRSPFLRAADRTAQVAFVPYGNLDQVSDGAPVYACALEMIFCSEVGRVKDVLPGEVSYKHPFREKDMRGQMVELDLDDDEPDAVAEAVLFVGGKPMLF